ncbi:splicing factor, Prp19-binding domain-containing protein [Mortierella sp. GBAus27b]|nr:Microfibrillar-associated protein 1 [Mortierella sp. GBA43]KAI8363203.1 splicing factor, Prp19-binding domain-containing protein [Mortierella sp. GBAus27b]
MSSKRAGLPSLNSLSKKEAFQPVKVQRYRAGKAPEGYVDPAHESSDEDEDSSSTPKGGAHGPVSQDEPPRMAYQVLNVERMTIERQMEKAQKAGSSRSDPAASGDRRLARLQATMTEDRRSRGDTRSRRHGGSDDEEEEEEEAQGEEDEEEEAALRRRKAARARAMRGEQEEEEELWGKGEEEDEEEEDTRKSRTRREGEESEGSSEYTSGSEEESSEDEAAARRKLMKPVFVPKSQRITIEEPVNADEAYEKAEKARLEAIEERKKESHQILKAYIARQAVEEEVPDVDNLADVDDTDGLDEEAEFEAWKLRELKRIKRDREELEAREAEKAEIERRRELTEEERVKEDMEYLAKKAKEEQATRDGKPIEKYYHKGAFFMDSDDPLFKRSTAGATPDAIKNIKALPKIMQVRNFGRAGQTKYTTLKDQDTSQRSGWTDRISKNLVQSHRMAGLRGDDYKIAAKVTHRDGGRDRDRDRERERGGRSGDSRGSGGGYGRENANRTELGKRRRD